MSALFEFKEVSKKLGDKLVLDDINFKVYENDIFGYLGPNGAGKTTTIRLLLGLFEPTKGQILVKGKNPKFAEVRKKIGFCLDYDGLYDGLTAHDNLEFFDRIYNSAPGRKDRIDQILHKVELKSTEKKLVYEFSKGMKRRLALGRALISNPELIILDEPMSGIDPDGQLLFKNIIKDLSTKTTIFFSSHNLNDVENLCNRVAILDKKILASDSIQHLKEIKSNKMYRFKIIEVKENFPKALKKIALLPGVKKVDQEGIYTNVYVNNDAEAKQILRTFLDMGVDIEEMVEPKANLEEIYFSLTRGERNA